MDSLLNRRTFIQRAAGVSLASLAVSPLAIGKPGAGASPLYTIGLSMYSLRFLFQDGSLEVFDYPAFVKKTFGITAIDVWDGAFPKDRKTDPEYYRELKRRSDKAGTDIFLLMAGAVDARGETRAERRGQVDLFKGAFF